jgi:ferrous iron transport protein A
MSLEDTASSGCGPLSDLRVGARGRLCDHPGAGPVKPRLADLGLVPGTPLEVLRRAPLGGPIEVELRGYRLVLRRAEAACLCVNRRDAQA